MAFKTDTSFLRFLTMGVEGTRRTIEYLRSGGLEPIELERYCTSNKIWATKVKRLRLPDLLCVKTGVRVEVRAKTDLKIRMSDAPANPQRTWDAGLRDEDVVGVIKCTETPTGGIRAAAKPNLFAVSDLRSSADSSILGPPKSASEGSERDRTWPSCVPTGDGKVIEVSKDKIVVLMRSGRRQTYSLNGKVSYVKVGDTFVGEASIIAGVVSRIVTVNDLKKRSWNPRQLVASSNAIDRYAAVKALPYRENSKALPLLDRAYKNEQEERVRLEIAASILRLDPGRGLPLLRATIDAPERPDLRMEAVLILTEVGSQEAASALQAVATDKRFDTDEIRQAAVWGLGRAGSRQYARLLPFLADPEDNVVLHAIAGFGSDTPKPVVRDLISLLSRPEARVRASASEALRLVGNDDVLTGLIEAARRNIWALITLGRLPATKVRSALAGNNALLKQVEPILASFSSDENWLANRASMESLNFLLSQVPQVH